MRIEFFVGVVIACSACRPDPAHPVGAAAVPVLQGPIVATVGQRAVTAAEATEYAATHADATAQALVERERKVITALEMGIDPELPRKRAMVRAFLADEIEAKVNAAQVDPGVLGEERLRAEEELREFSGFEAITVRVASMELHTQRNKLSPERVTELEAKVRAAAEALHAAVPATDAIEAAEALDVSGVDPELRVERLKNLKVLDRSETRPPPKGWVRAQVLAANLEGLRDGERTPIMEAGGVPLFAVRRARIDATPVSLSEVEALATERAVVRARRARLEGLLADLKLRTPVALYPELLEEGQ